MRSDLRLADLGKANDVPSKLMNVKIPAEVSDAIDRVAAETGCTKTAAVVALLNEGLDAAGELTRGMKRAPTETAPSADRRCSQSGCGKSKVAKGLCPAHYQQSRRFPPAAASPR